MKNCIYTYEKLLNHPDLSEAVGEILAVGEVLGELQQQRLERIRHLRQCVRVHARARTHFVFSIKAWPVRVFNF